MSTGGAFFDSNVPLYTLVQGDPRKSVETSLLGTCGSVSVQLLNKFADVGHRKIKLSSAEMNAAGAATIRALCAPPLLLTLASYEAALTLAERHHFFVAR